MQKPDLTCWQGRETNPRPPELVSQAHCTAAQTALALWATEAGTNDSFAHNWLESSNKSNKDKKPQRTAPEPSRVVRRQSCWRRASVAPVPRDGLQDPSLPSCSDCRRSTAATLSQRSATHGDHCRTATDGQTYSHTDRQTETHADRYIDPQQWGTLSESQRE